MKFAVFASIAASLLASTADAFPVGSGQCIAGDANLLGPHPMAPAGDLAAGSYSVSVAGAALTSEMASMVMAGETYTISIDAAEGAAFRGFLLRLSTADESSVAGTIETTSEAVQIMPSTGEAIGMFPNPGTCAVDVAGACHTERSDKTSVEVEFTLPDDFTGDMIDVEVTVVTQTTEYYYSKYSLSTGEAMEGPDMTIAETAVAAGFDTLVAALSAADLVGAVSDPDASLTVFAPTDDAFAALPDGLVECLLLEENIEGALTPILLYHVLGSVVLSTDLMDGMMAETLQGESVTVDLSDGVKISGATVTAADVAASNGVIHIIDSVIVPPSIDVAAFLATCPMETDPPMATDPPMEGMTIAETAVAAGFDTLVAALGAADLVGAVSDPDATLTVFAPTDDAFAALPEGLVECLLLEENIEGALTPILLYHVLGSVVLSTDLMDGMMAETLQGESVTVDLSDGVKISGATVSTADVAASNGVIHIIDSVIVPPSIDVAAFLETCPGDEPVDSGASSVGSAAAFFAAAAAALAM